ncbi:hypothetical protein O6H91_Y158500 [Diphasiastrum complanatum]|nr:hypothetical protein O6H91_Y158500 [Diphasiastrum complanatum]
MVDLGCLHFILGIEVLRGSDFIFISQVNYAQSLLKKFKMEVCKSVDTPMEQDVKVPNEDDERSFMDITLFRQLIGSLMWITITRPDLSFSVCRLSQSMQKPLNIHWKKAKRILRYISGTLDFGILYRGDVINLHAFSDSDFARDKRDRKSTSAYSTFIGEGVVSWLSKKQETISLSSTEAEYKALTTTTKEVLWIKRLLVELKIMDSEEAPIIYNDNISAQHLASNPIFHARSKHIEICHHFVREMVQAKEIALEHVPSNECVADLLTKPLQKTPFMKFRSSLGVISKAMIEPS